MNARLLLFVPALLLAALLPGCSDPGPVHDGEAAVAALRAAKWRDAEDAAGRAADVGDERYEAFRYFVRGNVAYARSLEMGAAAAGGDPEAGKMAYQYAEDALAYWQMAAASRADWPAARRNVERGLLRLQALRESKKEREKPPENEPRVDSEQPEKPPDDEPAEEAAVTVETADLPAGRVGSLLDLLIAREKRKRDVRKAQRRARGAEVERDW